MSQQTSFWHRLGNMLRGEDVLRTSGNGNGNGHADQPVGDQTASTDDPPQAHDEQSRSLSRWPRRQPSVAQMRDGYERVVHMMDTMQDHFQKQDERAEQLGHSVERMVGILEDLSNTGRNQQEHIRTVADNVREAGKHAAVMSESLSQMPRSLQAQAESVRTMLRQIEVSQESDTQLMHSLQQLSRAVDGLSTSGTAQVQTLERMNTAEREQRESLTLLVREQSRRFVVILVVAAILGLGALAALASVLVFRIGQ